MCGRHNMWCSEAEGLANRLTRPNASYKAFRVASALPAGRFAPSSSPAHKLGRDREGRDYAALLLIRTRGEDEGPIESRAGESGGGGRMSERENHMVSPLPNPRGSGGGRLARTRRARSASSTEPSFMTSHPASHIKPPQRHKVCRRLTWHTCLPEICSWALKNPCKIGRGVWPRILIKKAA